MTGLAIDLETLGDTRRLWHDWLEGAGGSVDAVASTLPDDRGEAAALLDAGADPKWRVSLERFAEDHAPVYLRPDADVSAALRAFAANGTRVVVFSDAPVELARVALSHLGATRRVEALEAGAGALARARQLLGEGCAVVVTRAELLDR